MSEPKDIWKERVRLGVDALGFRLVELGAGEVWMAAEVARQDVAPAVMTAAHAAIEMDKLVSLRGGDLDAAEARRTLQAAIKMSAARSELSMYQRLLSELLWKAVAHDPALMLEAMAEPHE